MPDRNLADEFMPPSARIGDQEARRLGLTKPAAMPDDEGLREELAKAYDEGSEDGYRAAGILLACLDEVANWSAEAAARHGNVGVREYAAGIAYAYRIGRGAALAADGTEPHPAHRHDETETGR